MNIYKEIELKVRKIVSNLSGAEGWGGALPLERIEASPTRDAAHGDIATNAAMVIAASAKTNPRAVAEKLLAPVRAIEGVANAEIAGPGFINMTLEPVIWQQVVAAILDAGTTYGCSDAGKGEKVNVEYVSANPTGPMHVGHGRGAVFGDALAKLLSKAGYAVTKEYYINDAGSQVDKLATSVAMRYLEALGEPLAEDALEGIYPGDYLVPVGKAMAEKYGEQFVERDAAGKLTLKGEDVWLPTLKREAVDAMMELIRSDLAVMGIAHDVFTSEAAITAAGRVEEAVAELEKQGLIYVGVLEPPKGKTPDDWEPRPQTLFKSSEFGDDCDRALKKSDGSWTYFAPDIACHYDKILRGHTKLVDVFGADHGGYVKRIAAAVKALSGGKAQVEVKLCQLVKFLRGGQPAKMSKRAGTFVTVREVVDEVGAGVFRFIMLTRKNDAPLDFDFEKVMEQSKDNPVFYVQYAHARAQSVLRNAAAEMPEALAKSRDEAASAVSGLTNPQELGLLRMLASWPRMVETAAAAYEPHRIAFFLQDVAAEFHGFWNRGNDDLSLRFLIKDDITLTAARLCLVQAVANVIASGLEVLGVEPVEEMR